MSMNAQRNLPGMRGFMGHAAREPMALADGESLVITIPGIRLRSLNTSFRIGSMGALMAARSKVKAQRAHIAMMLRTKFGNPPAPPLTVTIVRIAPGELDDDNLAGSAKGARDSVADWLGVDDRTSRSGVVWRYEQVKAGKGVYGVTIRIERSRQEQGWEVP